MARPTIVLPAGVLLAGILPTGALPTGAVARGMIRLVLLAGLVLAALPGAARAACTVQQRGTVAFTAVDRWLLVPVVVNGTDATFVLDTGAERSLVTQAAEQRLGLAHDEWVATRMRGIGGLVEHPNADPRSLTLAGIPLHRRTITRDTSLTVGDIQGATPPGHTVDGLLGRDFLSLFDLQLEIAAQRLTLFDVQGCSGRFLPWTGDYLDAPGQTLMTNALVVPISVDGHALRALLDTGATSSLIAAPGMVRLGLTPAVLAQDPGATAGGIGPHALEMRRHPFASLRIGPDQQPNPILWVAPVHLVPIVDALLGADWLETQQRVWISFATAQLFFVPH